jgi:hypothetical protein
METKKIETTGKWWAMYLKGYGKDWQRDCAFETEQDALNYAMGACAADSCDAIAYGVLNPESLHIADVGVRGYK